MGGNVDGESGYKRSSHQSQWTLLWYGQ